MKGHATFKIDSINWQIAIRAYEKLYDVTIDSAVPQSWFDENSDEIARRFGAVWVYAVNDIYGEPMFRDVLLSRIGVHVEYDWRPC